MTPRQKHTAELAADPVPGEEIRFILQLRDQRQLLLDKSAHLARCALRPAALQAGLGKRSQMRSRRSPCRHELVRILIAQLFQRKMAALDDVYALGEQFRRIQPRQHPTRALMHVHVAGGHERQVRCFAEHTQRVEPCRIAPATQQFDCDPAVSWKSPTQPVKLGKRGVGVERIARQPEYETAFGALRNIVTRETIPALLRRPMVIISERLP